MADEITILVKRIKALEDLLACYRVGSRPSESLFRRLDETREPVNEIIRRIAAGKAIDG